MSIEVKIISLCLTGLLALFFTTQPMQMPTLLLIVPFVLLFICLWFLTAALLKARGVSATRWLPVGLLTAGLPVVLLAMQSVGQLGLRDVVTLLALFSVVYIYMTRVVRTE